MSDFEKRRMMAIGVLRKEVSLGQGLMREHEKACLAVLEAEPKIKKHPQLDGMYSYEWKEWERICTIILKELGVE